MDAIEELREDVREGRINADRLVDLIASQQHQLQAAQQQLKTALNRIEELEKKLGGPPTTKLDEPYSMRSEEQRRQAQGQKKKRKQKRRGGRRKTKHKIALAEITERVYPEGSSPSECYLSHTRVVWRLKDRRAILIAYEVYRDSKGRYGRIPGALGKSEFGLEIVAEIAHLVYLIGLSFDKACQVLHFFQNLQLKKTHVDKLLYRLSRQWEREFEVLCTLLANSLVVHADETSWSINSVWALLSEKARILLFGVPKDAETLKQILDPATFAGLVFSDDAAVYENFSKSQKCWAHLLRKGIKLTLEDPDNAEYRQFTDRLFEIYREARRVQRDGRLGEAGLARHVDRLEDMICELCMPRWQMEPSGTEGLADDYRRLVNEVMRLGINAELFQFLTVEPPVQPNGSAQPVDGTNNESERTLRNPAQARDTGRANKTQRGARRQTIITTVLESLRLYLRQFTLPNVLDELNRWQQTGQSCFEKLLRKLKLTLPQTAQSTIDRLFVPTPASEPAPILSG
jgi:transposase